MTGGSIETLASIDAVRPVFLIVMGVSLVIFVLRLAAVSCGWPARFMIVGGLMLGVGYAIILPAYEGGLVESIHSPHTINLEAALVWHTLRLILMNAGWFTFGIGVAMHAKVLPHSAPRKAVVSISLESPPVSAHESAV